MERGVIETFDVLRPEVAPHFLLSYTTHRLRIAVLTEIQRLDFEHSFFSDKTDWPRIEKPRSVRHAFRLIVAMVRGNLDVLNAARNNDVIYLPGVQYFYFAILGVLFYRITGRKVIYHFHDLLTRKSSPLRFASLFVTHFVHNTKLSYEASVNVHPYLARKLNAVIPFPVRARQHSIASNDISENFKSRRNIIFVGQVTRHKGADMLLDAFSLLADSYPDTTLHIVGGCDDQVIMKRMEGRLRNDCWVKYWGYRDDVLNLIKHADVYVHPSPPSRFHESFGRGVVEAMSLGKPTVCFKSGALQEIVANGKTGLVCEHETPECLAANISKLLLDPALRSQYGNVARQQYEHNYSEDRVKQLWLDLLEL